MRKRKIDNPQPPDPRMQEKIQKLQMKHQQDMELQQAKIEADRNRSQEKMLADERLMQLKIQADKERYEEKIKSDYVDANVNEPAGSGRGGETY
jgi:hypothetical protein